MSTDVIDEPTVAGEHVRLDIPDAGLTTLSIHQRRIGMRIVPFGVVASHPVYGPLLFEPGAFDPVSPRDVRLRMDHEDPPTGLGSGYVERDGFAVMDFGVSDTQRGTDQLALVRDGVSRGASVGFIDLGLARYEMREGKRVRVFGPGSARLTEVSTTWRPTFESAGVTYVLSKEGGTPVPETETVEAQAASEKPQIANVKDEADRTMAGIVEHALKSSDERNRELSSRLEAVLSSIGDWQSRFEELARQNFSVPRGEEPPKPKLHDWVEVTLRRMAGQHISPTELKMLALDDVVTTEQPGAVPSVFTADYDDLINTDRPFLQSTRQVVPPRTGNSMTLPIITGRAVAPTAPPRLPAGYTDSATGTHEPEDGGTMNPENLELGAAWQTAITVYRRAPDTIWMSAAAVGAFIDAKAPLTNAPLYSNLAASFTAGGGAGGALSGLRPIYVPALDDVVGVDVIVGPSRGFVWAEDPARTLQADNPGQAGRDIVLAGGIFAAPRFADAFTVFAVDGGS